MKLSTSFLGGKISIWRIDPSRAAQIRELIQSSFDSETADKLLKRVVVIFLKIDETLARQRLTERGLEEGEIQRRLLQDREFWDKYHGKYDYIVENPQGKLDETIEKVLEIIQNHRKAL